MLQIMYHLLLPPLLPVAHQSLSLYIRFGLISPFIMWILSKPNSMTKHTKFFPFFFCIGFASTVLTKAHHDIMMMMMMMARCGKLRVTTLFYCTVHTTVSDTNISRLIRKWKKSKSQAMFRLYEYKSIRYEWQQQQQRSEGKTQKIDIPASPSFMKRFIKTNRMPRVNGTSSYVHPLAHSFTFHTTNTSEKTDRDRENVKTVLIDAIINFDFWIEFSLRSTLSRSFAFFISFSLHTQ